MFHLTNAAGESTEAISYFVGLARDVVEFEVVTHQLLYHIMDPLVLYVPQVLLKYALQCTAIGIDIYAFCPV